MGGRSRVGRRVQLEPDSWCMESMCLIRPPGRPEQSAMFRQAGGLKSFPENGWI